MPAARRHACGGSGWLAGVGGRAGWWGYSGWRLGCEGRGVGGVLGQCSFVPVVSSLPPLTPGVFHKECVITAFVGFSSCNGSGGRPC